MQERSRGAREEKSAVGTWRVRNTEPGLRATDAVMLRRVADTLSSHPQIGSAVSTSDLRNLADRIEAILSTPPSSDAGPP